MNNLAKQFLGLMLLLGIIVGCDKDNDPIFPEENEKYTVEYMINSNESSPIFDIEVTYNDKDGTEKSIIVTDFPWKKSFKVEAPFVAKFKGVYTVKAGVDIPRNVTVAKDVLFRVLEGNDLRELDNSNKKFTITKSHFNEYIKTNTIGFDFLYEIEK